MLLCDARSALLPFVVCRCSLLVACCYLSSGFVCRSLMSVVGCVRFVVLCGCLCDVRWSSFVVCCLLIGITDCLLVVVCCSLLSFGVCWLLVVVVVFVVCCNGGLLLFDD